MNKIHNIDVIDNNIKNTEIKKSDIHGYGLFATSKIEENTVLCVLDGQYLDDEIMRNLEMDINNYEYNYIPKSQKWVVRGFMTKYSAMNHSEKNNVAIFYEPLRVVATQEIERGEEILLDYNKSIFPEDIIEKYNIDISFLK